MKLTPSQLRRIIKEETQKVLREATYSSLDEVADRVIEVVLSDSSLSDVPDEVIRNIFKTKHAKVKEIINYFVSNSMGRDTPFGE